MVIASCVRPAAALLLAFLSGCASLPSSGPTASRIVSAQQHDANFEIVALDEAGLERASAQAQAVDGSIAALDTAGTVDTIGLGDTLQISIYEIGASLFSGRSSMALQNAFTPATGQAETLPPIQVGRDGTVTLPWIGTLPAAGETTDALAGAITARLRGKSENPQVLVTIRDNVSNTVFVMGDVRKPGRFALTLSRERLLDALAMAGGSEAASVDMVARLTRGARTVEAPLSEIVPGSAQDVRLLPQDRISFLAQPRSYVVLGASGKVAQTPFGSPRVSLAEAIARAGGPSEQQADASAVFVFRYEPAAFDGSPLPGARPVAYRLNLREPQGYFLSQRFEMRSRDVIYIANARANIPTKAIQILNLFFSPFYTARVLTQ